MTLVKSMGRVTQTGQLQIPQHILRLAGAEHGQMVEFELGPRDVIRVTLKKKRKPGNPSPRKIRKTVR
ncbi:MAG: hypothetical protein ISS81_06970 [Candidatus Marinimicrobia bacterium]|nr:hypothetical protein [Candidatus Neomarinimicrobiota bacterium]